MKNLLPLITFCSFRPTFITVYHIPLQNIPEIWRVTIHAVPLLQKFVKRCNFLKMNVGYAFSVKYTINKRHTSHHFILEYLQMKTFQGQTFDLRTHKIVDEFTSLTFPNIAYRVEF